MRNKTEQLIESIRNEVEMEEEKVSPVRKKAIKVGPKGTIDLQSTSTKEKQKLQSEIVKKFDQLLKLTAEDENDPLIKRFKSAVDKLQAPVEFSRRQAPGQFSELARSKSIEDNDMYTLQKLKKDLNDAIKTRKQNFKKLSEKFTG